MKILDILIIVFGVIGFLAFAFAVALLTAIPHTIFVSHDYWTSVWFLWGIYVAGCLVMYFFIKFLDRKGLYKVSDEEYRRHFRR